MIDLIIGVSAGVIIGGLALELIMKLYRLIYTSTAKDNQLHIPKEVMKSGWDMPAIPVSEEKTEIAERRVFNAEENAIKRDLEKRGR